MQKVNKPALDEIKPDKTLYGAASLTKVVNGIYFPISKVELITKYGEKFVHYSKSNYKTIREILETTSRELFLSMSDFVDACSKRG
jgi:hypothetical protein